MFPVYSGEWALWERNKASAPGSTARFRWVQEQLPAVEALAALLGKDTQKPVRSWKGFKTSYFSLLSTPGC